MDSHSKLLQEIYPWLTNKEAKEVMVRVYDRILKIDVSERKIQHIITQEVRVIQMEREKYGRR